MSGGGGTNTNTIQNADPWSGQQPYLLDVFQQAQQQYQKQQPQYYPGQTVAQPTAATQQGQQMMLDASGQAQNTSQSALGYNQFVTGGGLLNPQANPWLAPAAAGTVQPVYQQLMQSTLPGIRNQFQGAGQMGGTRDSLAEGTAIGLTNQGALNTIANMYNTAYGQSLAATSAAQTAEPGLISAAAQPGAMASAVGTQQQQQAQANINADIAKWNYNQTLPQQALATYAAMISGNFGGMTTGQGWASGGGITPLQGIGAAASLAAIYSAFSGGAAGGGAGAAAGTGTAIAAAETVGETALMSA